MLFEIAESTHLSLESLSSLLTQGIGGGLSRAHRIAVTDGLNVAWSGLPIGHCGTRFYRIRSRSVLCVALSWFPYAYVRRQPTTTYPWEGFCGVVYVLIGSTPVHHKAFGSHYHSLHPPPYPEMRGKYCIVNYVKSLNKPVGAVRNLGRLHPLNLQESAL